MSIDHICMLGHHFTSLQFRKLFIKHEMYKEISFYSNDELASWALEFYEPVYYLQLDIVNVPHDIALDSFHGRTIFIVGSKIRSVNQHTILIQSIKKSEKRVNDKFRHLSHTTNIQQYFIPETCTCCQNYEKVINRFGDERYIQIDIPNELTDMFENADLYHEYNTRIINDTQDLSVQHFDISSIVFNLRYNNMHIIEWCFKNNIHLMYKPWSDKKRELYWFTVYAWFNDKNQSHANFHVILDKMSTEVLHDTLMFLLDEDAGYAYYHIINYLYTKRQEDFDENLIHITYQTFHPNVFHQVRSFLPSCNYELIKHNIDHLSENKVLSEMVEEYVKEYGKPNRLSFYRYQEELKLEQDRIEKLGEIVSKEFDMFSQFPSALKSMV